MNFKELTVPKKVVYIIALVLAILLFLFVFGSKILLLGFGRSTDVDVSKLAAGSPEKFAVLSSRGTQGNVGST